MSASNSITHDEIGCSACNQHSDIITQCDKCLKWFCDHCHGLTPDIVAQMPSLFEAGLHWLCLPCRVKPFAPISTTTEYISSYSQTVTKTLPPSPKMVKTAISKSPPDPAVEMNDTGSPPSPFAKHPKPRSPPSGLDETSIVYHLYFPQDQTKQLGSRY